METPAEPPLVIFTDLDGTFLDHHTYSFEPALPAFRRCQAAGIPIVFCSSKTRAEIEPLRAKLSAADPFIVENGGAVFLPPSCFPFELDFPPIGDYRVIELGVRYEALTAALDRLSASLGVPVRAFHEMTPSDIADQTGLSLSDAELAAQREYDEPFCLLSEDPAAAAVILAAIETSGLHWTRGGRFYHLVGHSGKGAAVAALTELYRRCNPPLRTVALGDSANDVSLFQAVDVAILVQRPNGEYEPEVLTQMPSVHCSPLPGPHGWHAAVQDLLAQCGL